jgi:hypothetical protein
MVITFPRHILEMRLQRKSGKSVRSRVKNAKAFVCPYPYSDPPDFETLNIYYLEDWQNSPNRIQTDAADFAAHPVEASRFRTDP